MGKTSPNQYCKVTVVLHHILESEEFEGEYEAMTIKGVPHGVLITGSDSSSAEKALARLVAGLKAFGFVGRVAVEDAKEVRQKLFDMALRGAAFRPSREVLQRKWNTI